MVKPIPTVDGRSDQRYKIGFKIRGHKAQLYLLLPNPPKMVFDCPIPCPDLLPCSFVVGNIGLFALRYTAKNIRAVAFVRNHNVGKFGMQPGATLADKPSQKVKYLCSFFAD